MHTLICIDELASPHRHPSNKGDSMFPYSLQVLVVNRQIAEARKLAEARKRGYPVGLQNYVKDQSPS